MIEVTDLHDKLLYVNADMIEIVEAKPDTQIVLSNGKHIYVKESPEEIAKRVVKYRRECCEVDAGDALSTAAEEGERQ